jgi:hypothetical protein
LKLGATNVVRVSDRLIIGPSRREPSEHARARQAWWSSTEKWDRLYSPDVRWEVPIVLWLSASIVERVNFWRTCAWLRHLGITARDVFPVELAPMPPPKVPEEPIPSFNCTASVADHADPVLLERLADARPFPRARYDRAVSLWDRYTDENPLPFARSCSRGIKGFPELPPLWAFLSCLFPRTTPQGALCLSRFDELLLIILSKEWQTALAVFVHKSEAGVELRQLLTCTGDLFLPRRLDQWVRQGSTELVQRAAGPKPDTPMKSSVYRIGERGLRLRESGLEDLSEAPALPIAGTDAYSSSAPWVVRSNGQLARHAGVAGG